MTKIEKIIKNDREQYLLTCNSTSATVDINDGMNITGFTVNGEDIIIYDHKRYINGGTYGIPILYPTPNRIYNNEFIFEDKRYTAKMHGFIRKAPFTNIITYSEKDSVSIFGEYIVDENNPTFSMFPFISTLKIIIKLTDNTVCINYEVKNNDIKNIAFGIAIHPFFMRDDNTLIKSNVKYMMIANEEKIPTGKLTEIKNTPNDLSEYKNVDNLTYDTVFMTENTGVSAEIFYKNKNRKVNITSDDNCSHLVIYTPLNKNFICLEPQTSSTDCHNLHNKGFIKEANLFIIEPNKTKSGYFKIMITN